MRSPARAARFLAQRGYTVDTLLEPDNALGIVQASAPRLVLVELMLSGGTGRLLIRALREAGGPTIVAMSELDESALALDGGAERFLPKPLDPPALFTAVRDLIGSPLEELA